MIPFPIITKLIKKEEAISFGSISLTIIKHDGHATRYKWIEETSEMDDTLTSGEGLPKKQRENTESVKKLLKILQE
jgi:hypothetical protein